MLHEEEAYREGLQIEDLNHVTLNGRKIVPMTTDDAPVRIAVIGAGLIGRRHIQHILAEPRCRLAGIVDPDPNARRLAQQAQTTYYAEIDAFLKAADAEAAIISTPNDTHAPLGIQCAQAGLHLLVEKPLAADLRSGAALIEQTVKSSIQILVGHHRRFNPYIEATRRILEAGTLGTVTAVNALWTTLKPDGYFDVAWRRRPGGGPVLINLIHDIDCLRYLFGDIERLYAESSSGVRGFAVEDTAALVLRFCSGVLATIVTSDAAASPYNFESATGENPLLHAAAQDCYRIFGTRATLSFPDMTLWDYEGADGQGWSDPIASRRCPVEFAPPLERQLRHFCDVVRGNTAPRCSAEDALKTLTVTLAVGEAARKGAPITFDWAGLPDG
ncbi:MAG: gfo/Idh/MocA family oxidoreductase, partial [Desulfobacteraceae bacterium]